MTWNINWKSAETLLATPGDNNHSEIGNTSAHQIYKEELDLNLYNTLDEFKEEVFQTIEGIASKLEALNRQAEALEDQTTVLEERTTAVEQQMTAVEDQTTAVEDQRQL